MFKVRTPIEPMKPAALGGLLPRHRQRAELRFQPIETGRRVEVQREEVVQHEAEPVALPEPALSVPSSEDASSGQRESKGFLLSALTGR